MNIRKRPKKKVEELSSQFKTEITPLHVAAPSFGNASLAIDALFFRCTQIYAENVS